MSTKIKILLNVVFIILLSGCARSGSTRDKVLIQPLKIQITPALTHWLPEVNACVERITQTGSIVDILPSDYIKQDSADLAIRLGEKESEDKNLSILGYETIRFVVNSQNPLTQISAESLHGILDGSLTNWNQLSELKANDSEFNYEITLYSYGEGNDLNRIISNTFLENATFTKDAWYIGSWETMRQSIEKTPGAIGFILESQTSGTLITLEIMDPDLLYGDVKQPVLAITQSEPTGSLLHLLLCLQATD